MVPLEDSFISDEEIEYCPLCVEEMDISDKNFKPCPCGYQICQFCYNNIRQNPELNGRCPGCRRLYDDESVEYKTLTVEEYKSQQLRREKRDREKKQKEKEKKESELASKKHLAGLRVVQKNLVYVTGLSPPCPPEDLHSVLRSDKYFGQYGKISKIVVNRKNPPSHSSSSSSHSIVVYVTFTRKEDATRCINELDGSLCDGRTLRAAHGTTKYCSSYLRGNSCPNPNCMFLHEPGEEADSYTRKDLSTHQGIKMGMSEQRDSHVFDDHKHQPSQDEDRTTAQAASSNATPVINSAVPVLPPTAHWAKPQAEPVEATSAANSALANPSAFPTLGEIFKDQKAQKKDSKKTKGKNNKEGSSGLDDLEHDDSMVVQFAEDCSERLKSLADSKEKLMVYFDELSEDSSVPPFFHFNDSINMSGDLPSSEERKVYAIHIIERFLLRPMKKYHLAYSNQPLSQQQQFLQQQAQLQQQQQQLQGQLQSTPAQYQQQVPQSQAGAQSLSFQQPTDAASQQQQQMLLMQLQQQQLKGQQAQAPGQPNSQMTRGPQLASQLNAIRVSERSKTSTPPPPGLFGKHQDAAPQSQQTPQSSSSQLLNQLMSGKK